MSKKIIEQIVPQKMILERSHENEEMYLKAIWLLEEAGEKPAKAADIAKILHISLPSTVEMLGKMDSRKLISYKGRKGATLLAKGRKISERVIRNLRLTEVFFKKVLGLSPDSEDICRFEHVMSDRVASAIEKLLKKPSKCPHGKKIPRI